MSDQPNAQTPTPNFDRFMAALTSVIQRHMPWPFVDVERDSPEGRASAEAIAQALIPTIAKEFNDLRGGLETKERT